MKHEGQRTSVLSKMFPTIPSSFGHADVFQRKFSHPRAQRAASPSKRCIKQSNRRSGASTLMSTQEVIVVVQLRLNANHREEFLRTLLISLNALGLRQNVFLTNCSAAPRTTTRLFFFKCGAHEKHSNKTGFIAIFLESTQTHICSRLR